ncbi:hypothetical protein AMTR_s00131p00117350 [Amborella trichopoda]|uniref:Pollen Ole e 1 allergen and extensin family protein n=1 Tax=Amborella trichopoda TaxID=13333 RepID=W1NR87_AMBTC|nr:hypothetical protein AMTR_s00131p00117350 [Amborella trichopoda]
MASTHVSLPMISLFFAAAVLSTLALKVNGITITTGHIDGFLYCSKSGNQEPGASGIPRTPVEVVCGAANATITSVFTQPNGAYVFTFNLLDTALFDPSTCYIKINLPIVSCTLLPTSGILRGPIVVFNTLGQTLNMGVRPLIHIA